ncbi:VOC family protein [Streptomyces sp. TRM66268-LWL]|uniref:VOC family protein n=1 Tax=Streptomyces polyasparticus TaxID=2767826 RepID=A0ABR7SK58_9ACTN|nr:VOC family protein [Streptomyces polyasparticus]MBC9715699.1 VOC family protein [Streptomyces polyasparticus]
MSSRLFSISFDAQDPERLAEFWAGTLGLGRAEEVPAYGGVTLLSGNDAGYRIGFRHSAARKTDQNRLHFDLTSSSAQDQEETVARALGLGAQRIDIGQGPDAAHAVLADPEGNEFCVIEPGNNFLAGCGRIGALACDGSQAVGYFWSETLAWPLVWDQDEETAIQSPDGGTKITWGGPPRMPDPGREPHLDLVADGDQEAEVERLIGLGAKRLGATDGVVLMTDPDGNEFRVLALH